MFKDITDMYFSYNQSLENFDTANLIGEELWLDDIYYLYTYPEDRLEISNLLREELELREITLDDLSLSELDYYNLNYQSYEENYVETYDEY